MRSPVDKGSFWWSESKLGEPKNGPRKLCQNWTQIMYKTHGQFANVIPYHPGVLYFNKGPLSGIFDIISYKIWNVIYLDIISYYRQYWFRSFSPKLNFEILVFLFRSEDAGWFQCNHPKSSEPPAEPRLNIRLNRCGYTRYTVYRSTVRVSTAVELTADCSFVNRARDQWTVRQAAILTFFHSGWPINAPPSSAWVSPQRVTNEEFYVTTQREIIF